MLLYGMLCVGLPACLHYTSACVGVGFRGRALFAVLLGLAAAVCMCANCKNCFESHLWQVLGCVSERHGFFC
jgi:hypothetical protein